MKQSLKELDEESFKEVVRRFKIENFDHKGKLKKKYRRKLEKHMEVEDYKKAMVENNILGVEESYYQQEAFKMAVDWYNKLTPQEREDWFNMVMIPRDKDLK